MFTSSSLTVKVVMLGESGVGKSNLVLRYVSGNFRSDSEPTIGASFMTKILCLGDRTAKLNLWDTAGQERYHSLTRMYYQDAHAAVLVYDIANEMTFRALETWQDFMSVLVVVGNKQDLIEQEQVDPERVRDWCRSVGCVYRRTSAKENIGVEQLFTDLAELVLVQMKKREDYISLNESSIQPLGRHHYKLAGFFTGFSIVMMCPEPVFESWVELLWKHLIERDVYYHGSLRPMLSNSQDLFAAELFALRHALAGSKVKDHKEFRWLSDQSK